MGAPRPDLAARLDEVDCVALMLVDPRRYGEDVGVEDDVFRWETLGDEELVRPIEDLDLVYLRVRLPLLV